MDTENDLVLNLTTDSRDFSDSKRAKLKRKDRLKRKRDERRGVGDANTGGNATIDENASGVDSDKRQKEKEKQEDTLNHKPEEKRHRTGNRSVNSTQHQSKNKFSSLFRNNPDIPKLENTSVDQISEKVFSNQSFSTLNLHPYMVSNLEAQGFKQATSVQMKAVPAILQCTDVLIKSQTGSGKTLAYGIPIIQHLQELKPKVERCHGAYAVIIVPTRELAIQTYETFIKLVKPFTWIVPGCIMGGEQKKKEKSRLRKGINVLISTPGRLLDHLQSTKSLQLCRLKWMVIDEADRLLELGFEQIISQIILALRERGPENQHAVLLSATLSPGVERLAGMSLKDPVDVDLSQDSASSLTAHAPTLTLKKGDSADTSMLTTPSGLRHHFLMVPSKLRLVTLAAFILWKCRFSNKKSKMLVFMATQDAVDFHHMLLGNILNQNIEDEDDENKLLFFRLHGDMAQKDRTKIFKDFSESPSGILLCTDVAARGLDLPAVRWIVQYTAPTSPEDYVHRAGRTARVGSQGRAVLFLSPSESEYITLLNSHKISLTEVKMDDVLHTLLLDDDLVMSQGQRPNTVQERATALQRKIEEHTLENKEVRPLARKAYQSYIRAYSTYPSSVKHIFHIRHLHLGHVAKSFGLQEAPTHIGGIVGKFAKMDKGKHKRRGKKGENKVPRVAPKMQNHLNIKSMSLSEFSSGLGAGGGPVTKKMQRSLKPGSQQKKPKVKRLKIKQPKK